MCKLVGFCIFMIGTGSMYPELKAGDLVVIKKYKEYNTNDVVTYTSSNHKHTITHRIISKENGIYATKGDANEAKDIKPVLEANILGKVIYKLKILPLWVLRLLDQLTGA